MVVCCGEACLLKSLWDNWMTEPPSGTVFLNDKGAPRYIWQANGEDYDPDKVVEVVVE